MKLPATIMRDPSPAEVLELQLSTDTDMVLVDKADQIIARDPYGSTLVAWALRNGCDLPTWRREIRP